MKEIEIEGKTVTLAVEKGLSELGLRRDQVEVQVLQEPAPGFLGMGAKPAKVRIREKIWGEAQHEEAAPREAESNYGSRNPHPIRDNSPYASSGAPRRRTGVPRGRTVEGRPPQGPRPGGHRDRGGSTLKSVVPPPPSDTGKACTEAKVVIEELLPLVECSASKVATSWDADQVRVRAEIETPDTEFLLGQEGKVLESLQFLVTLTLSRRMGTPVAVLVEVGSYWREREEEIMLQVHQAMEAVRRTKQPVRLKPMSAVMRRLVHRSLANHPEIETVSEGEGIWRKVVLKPKHRRGR
jgi:spoIIIJ-associated protein